ncbi:hypothetical protein ACFPA1_09635 [Neobacillus sp. GCM10023253]|uniref:hypothetical protein n=1 Tax=Neobacillus sp. GCM10023253 TaxID=3252644 RepID=UPI00360B6FFA
MSDKTVDQGLPNTPANAWPVSVTNFPSNHTHLGRAPSDLVTVRGRLDNDFIIRDFIRIFPDSTQAPFEIPENQIFILMDINFTFLSSPINPTSGIHPFLSILVPANSQVYFQSATEPTDIEGNGGGSISLTSGVAISEPFEVGFSKTFEAATVTLNGYFMDFS